MKISALLAASTLSAAFALPLTASAQQAPGSQPPPDQQYQQQPYQQQPYQQQQAPQAVNPPASKMQRRYQKMLASLNLSQQQQQQVAALIDQYAAQHPAGSPRDPQSLKDLRDQIFSVLTPEQHQQLHQEMLAARARREQKMAQQQQQSPDQQYQQQPPDQQYQQQPPHEQQPPQQPPA